MVSPKVDQDIQHYGISDQEDMSKKLLREDVPLANTTSSSSPSTLMYFLVIEEILNLVIFRSHPKFLREGFKKKVGIFQLCRRPPLPPPKVGKYPKKFT